ncbi:MAG: glycosyltransferase family 2 protein [Comamonadaceae bacterium]|nr:MAG: glycosyltransferase family 2 protein [Comamonadaceae bacterium]
MIPAIAYLPLLLVALGTVPVVVSFLQFLLVGLHASRHRLSDCRDYTPRVAFIVPAWNEGPSLGATIDALMAQSYPKDAVRVYVVDDASTDETPQLLREKTARYPGAVFHLRRQQGGQGKSHTLNHGLQVVLDEDWAQAIMIMDADVLFEPLTLRRMARHLADPGVGAVTAYIKEGSQPDNVVCRFIAFEYITAQAAARRSQNVAGALACLAGGAQLHSRENMLAIGGRIDTTSLAEDTFTTFRTQLGGRRAVFDGNAVVWAEEPGSLTALWKQRLRWARGNLQLSAAYRHLWFRPGLHRGLGGFWFGLVFFSIVSMPLLMIGSSIGLLWLDAIAPDLARNAFSGLWITTFLVYLFVTGFSFVIDPATARRAWFEGFAYPGLITLGIMVLFGLPPQWISLWPAPQANPAAARLFDALRIFVFCWTSLCMLAAWGVYRLDRAGAPHWLRDGLLLLVGYGPFNCAVAFAAMVAEWRKAEMRWDKTPKTGKGTILK